MPPLNDQTDAFEGELYFPTRLSSDVTHCANVLDPKTESLLLWLIAKSHVLLVVEVACVHPGARQPVSATTVTFVVITFLALLPSAEIANVGITAAPASPSPGVLHADRVPLAFVVLGLVEERADPGPSIRRTLLPEIPFVATRRYLG